MGSKVLPILLLGSFLALNLMAQSASRPNSSESAFSPELIHDLITIRDAALADDYAFRQVAHLTENIGPRPSGSAQAQQAAQYVAEELRKLGLEVRLEEVKVPHWVRGSETAELVEFPGQVPKTSQKIVVTALGGSTATPADGITAEVVVVRNFEELNTLGRSKVAGKIVLFNFPFDTKKAAAGYALDAYGEAVVYRGAGAKTAAELGAVASLVRSVGGAEYRLPHTGFSTPAGIPAGAVAAEDAELVSDLAAQGKVRMRLVLTPQSLPDTTGYNVVADLRGSEHPEQVVVASGHLDSWDLGTGAIDDGAGVAVAMETAQLLQTLHLRPKRTIRVIAWVDEESGGRGRQAYTAAHSAEFANHVAAIESDLGAAHPLGFNVKMSAQAMEALKPVQKILESFGANLIKVVPFSPGADISSMSQAGVPALGIMQDGRTYFNYHHTAADTLDKIDPAELRENAAAMAVMGYALACAAQPLPR
ncbi:MAG TPA: M20/M25/M40 family metallo-hydrolase [Candidatus Dormibacteraeota bacterium]|nr:M20/M25/M40 family metallo-hydrolase [Candidatus Dormibacteraeota bacterium]